MSLPKTRLSFASGCPCHPTRRGFLGGLAATAVAAAAGPARSQPAAKNWIDVHHHLTPPEFIAVVGAKMPLPPPQRNWSVAASLDQMDRAGVATSMLSMTTPGLWFGNVAETKALARACNDYAATLVRDHPGRFGNFVALPLPDIDSSLAEIAYGLDTLKADGVLMFTSYDGKWLGDPAFAPVMAELNRRAAVVYTHPTSAQCCVNLMGNVAPDPMIEYGTDTTRTIASLLFSGAAARYPDIKFIFSHAGGTMPFLIERFEFQARNPAAAKLVPDGVVPTLKKFYYDTAQSANPEAMGALKTLVGTSRILFGTDYPYRTVEEHVVNIGTCGFADAELAAIGRGNAVPLLPGVAHA